ncbi:hypothetical protein H6802_03995 [Candidatus Nomurabacteria bacterium]|nr:hypothetical protein [Candidatus Nomurabacteria bacterium]MCB9826949.1 hypothetical protein [Candidatus Nomurabacteria bacterium]MCB9828021.1 hypothetical protein [Candidatus Nomurabacteria bacterium]HXK52529.1 Ig-like domain-containing protein [bacterium]
MAQKRHYHEEILIKRLKRTILAVIGIPVLVIAIMAFFGPTVASIFGFVSIDRWTKAPGDTIAPTVPGFRSPPGSVKDTKITLNGFGEPGSVIKLFINGPEKQSTVVGNDGTFTFQDVELINGKNTLFLKAQDQAGNESEASERVEITVDTIEPKIEITAPEKDKTVKNLNERVLIQGKISEKATIRINDRLAVQKPDLTFEFILGVKQGEVEVTVEAVDEAGNKKEEKLKFTYLKQSE